MKDKQKTRPPKLRKVMISIHAFLDYLFRIVMLNLLIVVPALLPFFIYSKIDVGEGTSATLIGYATLLPAAIYLIPAIVAAVDVLRMYQDKLTKGVFKEFFVSFGKHFLKSIVISVIVFGIIFILLLDVKFNSITIQGPIIYFINNLSDLLCLVGLALTVSFLLIGIYVIIHIPLVMAYFEGLSLGQYIKLSFIMSFKNVWKTLLCLLVVVAFLVLDLVLPVATFIIGVSIPLYLIVKITFKDYIKIYRKVENNEKDNEENV